MAQQNGCSMDLAVDEDGLEGDVDGVVVDGSSAINGHTSTATSVDAGAAAGPSSSAPVISRVDRDVIRLIAQHLQNLGLKYDNFLIYLLKSMLYSGDTIAVGCLVKSYPGQLIPWHVSQLIPSRPYDNDIEYVVYGSKCQNFVYW